MIKPCRGHPNLPSGIYHFGCRKKSTELASEGEYTILLKSKAVLKDLFMDRMPLCESVEEPRTLR